MIQHIASNDQIKESVQGITGISVSGYKSLYEECSIEIRPLTILAGANSSGKSSIMQPLLLLKQTLEAPYDPGALLLNGSNIKFTFANQILSLYREKYNDRFSIKMQVNDSYFKNTFIKKENKGIDLFETRYSLENAGEIRISSLMNHEDYMKELPQWLINFHENTLAIEILGERPQWSAKRERCFFELELSLDKKIFGGFKSSDSFQILIHNLIHVPGVRGNPGRAYPTTSVSSEFPGNFESYVASLINFWKTTEDTRLQELNSNLKSLGLTNKIDAKQVNDVQIELLVSRLPQSSDARDMVSLADVGFGVSQTLPVLVSLLVAEQGQLVYLEQPEIHLHPRAQVTLAEIIANAANRGVRVVMETHSELLLLAVQSLVAEGNLSPDKVKLHWFTRREDGVTQVSSAELDETGAFGDWPEDFSDISLKLESRYLDAAESRLLKS